MEINQEFNFDGDVRLPTKIVPGGFVLSLLLAVLMYLGVVSTTLPRFTYVIVATVILFVITTLLVVNDLAGG